MGAHGSVPQLFIVSPFEEHNVWIDPTGTQPSSTTSGPQITQYPGGSPNTRVVSGGMLLGYGGREGRLSYEEVRTSQGSRGLEFKHVWRRSEHAFLRETAIFEANVALVGLTGGVGDFDENDLVFADIYQVDNDLLATPEVHDYGRVRGDKFPRNGMGPSVYIGPVLTHIVFRLYVHGDSGVAARYRVREY